MIWLKVVGGLAFALIAFAIIVGFSLIVGFPVMWLWNWLMPALFHLPLVTFWQAVGLMILGHLLVGNSSPSSSKE